MKYNVDDVRKQAKRYAHEFDLEGMINSIDFSKVDAKKLKKIDFSRGMESARHQLEQLPKVRITTQPVPEPEDNEGGFVGGLLLGMVLGAIIALLFAPKTGQDTREMVVGTVGDLKHKVAGDGSDVDDELVMNVDAAVDSVDDTFSDEPAIERNFG